MKTKNKETILVTGSAGFIGFHTSKRLLDLGHKVVGVDNLNDYYDPKLKKDRNNILKQYPKYKFYKGNLENLKFVQKVLAENTSTKLGTGKITKICHLAAQAGVRYSLTHPHTYMQSNLVAFTNLIDEAKNHKIKTFVYASSSSVYGNNKKIPFSTTDNVDKPISLYAASKKANELIAYTYHHLYNMNCTGLRFFTVYGPYGRPDMALMLFADAITKNKAIKVFNYGKMERDFTYIDDIVSGILSSLKKSYSYEVFNLGNHKPTKLNHFIGLIEKNLGKTAKKKLLPIQAGDVPRTYADIKDSKKKLNFTPKTPIEQGIKLTLDWYKKYYKI